MTAVIDVLRDRGYTQVDESRLVRAVQDLLPETDAGAVLTADDRRFMEQHSGLRADSAAVTNAVERLAARRITQAAQTLDTRAVAERLGVHRTRVQHLLEAGDLYAYRDGRYNRYPLWQFTADGRPLPGLRQVLAALGPVHRSVVAGFMTSPQPELDAGAGPQTARDWLLGDGDPRPVVELAGGVLEPW
jgi:excisionase family DNA binding protein